MSDPEHEAPAEKFAFRAIGSIQNDFHYQYEAPRQAVFAGGCSLLKWSSPVYRSCAEDLTGFERIWLVWVFDRNLSGKFKTKVRVPVPAEKDHYSVFATRSPYRPNPIGISAVELLEIRPDGLLLGACDLLDGTAVLDVKPYIPEADAFPQSKAGWRDRVENSSYQVSFLPQAAEQCEFIKSTGGLDLVNFCLVQLRYRPLDKQRKRLTFAEEEKCWIIHCRTWKIFFTVDEENRSIIVKSISGNYTAEELSAGAEDKYQDKELHRAFIKRFG